MEKDTQTIETPGQIGTDLSADERAEILEELIDLDQVDDVRAERLIAAGIISVEMVADLSQNKIAELAECGKGVAKTIKDDALDILAAIKEDQGKDNNLPGSENTVDDIDDTGVAGQDENEVKYILQASVKGLKTGAVYSTEEIDEIEGGLTEKLLGYNVLEKVKG